MFFSDEDIIAFLLGEADSSLASRIRQSLPIDSDLVARVSHFRSLLNHLNGSGECYEPPSGLIEATLQRMEATDPPCLESQDGKGQDQSVVCSGGNASLLPMHARTRPWYAGMLSPSRGWGRSRRSQNVFDSIALSISLVCLSCLVLPALIRARFESRRAQCAENLRVNGQALFSFALQSSDRRLPAVAASGPESFAGVYAVRLYNMGLLGSSGQLRCVSLVGVERPTMCSVSISDFPTLDTLRRATQEQLARFQQMLGGDYAYNLGVLEKQSLVAPKNTGSSHFAILADAPIVLNERESWPAHDGHGVNILYDDGHVEFASHRCLQEGSLTRDHPYCNRFGNREAGLDDSDASLAPSSFPPLER